MTMNDYILLMHNDVPGEDRRRDEEWQAYFTKLRAAGVFQGGSAIGDGLCVTKSGLPRQISRHISGYIRIQAESLSAAQAMVEGNPVYEAGGTIEIRELPKSG
jgi:hypothetical protein